MFPILAQAQSLGDMAQRMAMEFTISWPPFLSNVVSFLLVALLLKRFAYQPILAALEARRVQIAEGVENARKSEEALAQAQSRREEILAEASQRAQQMVNDARQSAENLTKKQHEEAQAEAGRLLEQARAEIRRERTQMTSELRREVASLVVATTEKVAGKVLTDADQKRLNTAAVEEMTH